ncbi:MFS transporter [Variovorax sp. 2RAF20]
MSSAQASTLHGTAVEHVAGSSRRRQLIAAMIGNALEYYDFIIYAFLATTIAKRFFHGDDVAALLATFATFGVGFLARPVGAALIGRLADLRGRKIALQITIFGMAIGTVGIGLLPDYQSIGVAAPIALVALRIVQGLAAGGEWGSATAFIVESAPPGRRGFYGALGQASISASLLLSSLVVTALNFAYTPAEVDAWAWRVPFLAGIVLLPVGIYMRRNLVEPTVYREAQTAMNTPPTPASVAMRQMGLAFGFTVVWTVSFYIMLSYMPTFLVKHAGLTQSQALTSNSIALLFMVIASPIFGYISDRIGRKPLLLGCCVALAVLVYPLFWVVLQHKTLVVALTVQITLNLFLAAFSGAAPAALCELFPTRIRTASLSIGYALATALFGGFAPYIATWLIATTGQPISPTWYVIAAALVSGIAISRNRETAHDKLS